MSNVGLPPLYPPRERKSEHSDLYRKYLASPEWAEKRRQVLDATENTCEWCGGKATEVHHVTYARLGHERLTDLEAVCRACHDDADEHREAEAYFRRVDGWATKVLGSGWSIFNSFERVAERFEEWLAEKEEREERDW